MIICSFTPAREGGGDNLEQDNEVWRNNSLVTDATQCHDVVLPGNDAVMTLVMVGARAGHTPIQ